MEDVSEDGNEERADMLIFDDSVRGARRRTSREHHARGIGHLKTSSYFFSEGADSGRSELVISIVQFQIPLVFSQTSRYLP